MLLYYHIVTYLILPRKQIGFQKKRKNSTTILYTVVSPQISELLAFKKRLLIHQSYYIKGAKS